MNTAVIVIASSPVVGSVIFFFLLSGGSLFLFLFLEFAGAFPSHIVILSAINI